MVLIICTGMLFPATLSFCEVTFGKEVIVEHGETVKNAISFGQNVRVYGTVKKDAVSFGGNVIVESGGKVKSDAVSIGGNVIVKNNGEIRKNAVSVGGRVDVSYGGVVRGDRIKTGNFTPGLIFSHVVPHAPGRMMSNIARTLFLGPLMGVFGAIGVIIGIVFIIIKMIISFAIAALVTYLFPAHVSHMADYVQAEFPKALLFGLVILIVIPFLVLSLIITLIGIPLIPFVLVALFFVYIFGSVGIALWAGRIIPESEGRSQMANVLLGVLAIGILKNIPFIGLFVGIALCASSFGLVMLTRFATETPGAVY